MRQMQEEQLKARQVVLQQQAASAVAAASKTQREVYVGNLAAGLVTEPMLHQLFSTTMAAAFPEQCGARDPVVKVSVAPEGKYAFVELATSEMATSCLQLNQSVAVMGSTLSIGRPAGYVDPGKASSAAQTAAEALARFQAESAAARAAAGGGGGEAAAAAAAVTPFLCVDGMVTAEVLSSEQEHAEVVADLKEEFERHGAVLRVAVPRPEDPATAAAVLGTGPYGKAYVQFLEAEGARAARAAVDGRLFAGQRVAVAHMQAQEFMDAVGQKS
jgi:splicing factor U2AF subunit